ncbi:MAG: hypothetical protein MUF19_02210 [Candidatus Pacebacteria bacterium]|nr:hypothetical protein [Candidatus Paceibacterota bacterium]
MGEQNHDLILNEKIVTLDYVTETEGYFTALADNGSVSVSWRKNCNDWPLAGQHWTVRTLGADVFTGVEIAVAVMRES